MKIKTAQLLKSLRGETLVMPLDDKKKKEKATLGLILTNIILEPHKDKPGFRPLDAYKLAQRLESQKEVDITAGEFIQIRELVENNETFLPLVLGQVIEMLDNCEK